MPEASFHAIWFHYIYKKSRLWATFQMQFDGIHRLTINTKRKNDKKRTKCMMIQAGSTEPTASVVQADSSIVLTVSLPISTLFCGVLSLGAAHFDGFPL